IKVVCWDQGARREGNFSAAPGTYRFTSLPASKDAISRVEIEGCVMYHAGIPSVSGLVAS
ncbi:MAG: hypothetical protein WEA28_14930, partial [Xanthobacteraceae bacterium]